jgi:glycogen(starch) synthase
MRPRAHPPPAGRDRLVAEASAHVLRFDWADIAEQTVQVYGELEGASDGARRATRRPA